MESKDLKVMDISGDTEPKFDFRIVSEAEDTQFVTVVGRYQGMFYKSEKEMNFKIDVSFTATKISTESLDFKFEMTTFEWMADKPEAIFQGSLGPIVLSEEDYEHLENRIFEKIKIEFCEFSEKPRKFDEEDKLEAEKRKVSQAEFDQICSEGAEFWLVYSPGSVTERAVNIGNTHSTEGTNKYLQNLRDVLQFTGNICINVYVSALPKSVTIWPGKEEMELTEA